MFAGVGSPMTHAVGIGFRGSVPDQEMKGIERFFRERGSSCVIDLCPLADASVLGFLQAQPYRVTEFSNVLARRISPDEIFVQSSGEQAADLRIASEHEIPYWARVVSEGFSEYMPVSDDMVDLMAATCQNAQCWFAGRDEPAGGAAMSVQEDVALFFGDALLRRARGRGWQSLLIRARLAAAQRQGCDLAMATVLPGSVSHRNYERAGFELIYMRVNLLREFG